MGEKPHQKIVGMPNEKLGEYDARKNARAPGATRRGVAPTLSGVGTISMRGLVGSSPHHIVY
jgi:hypothetical protein